jgi:ferredoxin
MPIKKVTAIYFSPTGTSRKTVVAVAKGTGLPVQEIDLTTPNSREKFSRAFGADELAVVGLPVYAGRLPKYLDNFFSGLKAQNTPAIAIVLYGNREYDDALVELRILLEARGFIVKSGAAFIGEHTVSEKIATGRPDAKDLFIASDFGRWTLRYIASNNAGQLTLKGNYPFTKSGFDPRVRNDAHPGPRLVTTDKCTQCKVCEENCPWSAIDPVDCKVRNYDMCMHCYRCLKMCPTGAIQVTNDKFLEFLPKFEAMLNAQRKEPELFLPA